MSAVDELVLDPDEIARRVVENLHRLSSTASELVYSPFGEHSYYRDLIVKERSLSGSSQAEERLKRHAEQMDAIRRVADREALRRLGMSGLEYRVTPDRTDGYGGYFSPPAWLNELFATANRPGRVLSGLMVRFPLPPGVSSVSVPVVGAGSAVQPARDDSAAVDQAITDSEASSQVVPFGGHVDIPLQLLEQSPAGAHMDWAIFTDLNEAYDGDLELELLTGTAGKSDGLLGVMSIGGAVAVPYTSASPTGSGMWPFLSQMAAQVGKGRKRPPECWLMTTSRWFWLQGAEDTGTRPFGLSTRFFLGAEDDTPDPVDGLMGLPVFLADAIPTTLGPESKQDFISALRPRDMIILEGQPQTLIAREPLSGSLGVRVQMHANVAALTSRRPAGIGVLSGTGMTVQDGY